jgi:site-specific recombinase XerD
VSGDASVEDAVARFLAHKRALGRKYGSEERELRLLSRFAAEQNASLGDLTPALMQEFLGARPRNRPRSFNHLLRVTDGLLRWAVAQEVIEAAPALPRPRKTASSRVPFLFTTVQARDLLAAASRLPDNERARGRGHAYQAVFALCYGLGLRAAEACGLTLGSIDAGRSLLTVRGGKFGKDRLIPHGPRIGALIAAQAQRRRDSDPAAGPGAPLFTFDGRRSIHPGTASQVFHHLVPTLGLPVADGVSPPVLHCLRHSFAVGCLLRWYREGSDPQSKLHQLSTFMGHVDPESSAVYLTITVGLLAEANRRFEAFAGPAWLEAAP